MRMKLAAVAALLLVLLAFALPAHAAPVRTSSLTLNEATPRLGDTVTFTITTPKNVKNPRIEIMCYQGGALVYGEAGPADGPFVLGGGGSAWLTAGGPASCTATLFVIFWPGDPCHATPHQQEITFLASTVFEAGG